MKHKVWWLLLVMCALVLLLSMNGTSNALADPKFTLTIYINPPGGEGGDTSPGAGNHSYSEGTTVPVSAVATPNSDWRFTGWTGPDAAECLAGSVFMDKDKSCTATFSSNYYILTSADPLDGGNVLKVPDAADYPVGAEVTLDPKPNPGFQFDGWMGPEKDTCKNLSIVMPAKDITCTAVFTRLLPAGTNDKWMADLSTSIQDRRLRDVVLPGSHDTGTYSFNQNSHWVAFTDIAPIWQWIQDLDLIIGNTPVSIASAWAKTQSGSVYWQLNGGIRYFDLRFVKHINGIPYVYHGELRGDADRDTVLNDIKKFLDEPGHEKEIIILDFKYWKNMGDISHRTFVDKLIELFGDKMIPEDDWDKPLSQIWAQDNQPQIIVIYESFNASWLSDPADANLFWDYSDPGVCRPWAGTSNEGLLYSRLKGHMDSPCDENYLDTEFFIWQGITTPDFTDIRCGVSKQIFRWLDDHKLYCLVPGISARCAEMATFAVAACPDKLLDDSPISIREMATASTTPGEITPESTELARSWWQNCENRARQNMNILLVDFLEYGDFNVVEVSKDINLGEYNNKPSMPTLQSMSGREGFTVDFSTGFNDQDLCDKHMATIDWGDGTDIEAATVHEIMGDARPTMLEGSHVYADNGSYDVTVCLQDGPKPIDSDDGVYFYHYSEICDSLSIEIANVAPTVNAGADVTINEADTFTLEPATFNDRGTLDTHTAIIDWDDRRPADLSTKIVGVVAESPFGPPGSTSGAYGTVAGSRMYGDNSVYSVEVCVTDKDSAITCDVVDVTVNNVDPTVFFDKSAAISFAGGPAFLARRGVEQTFDSSATDIGSDDLTYAWSFPPSALGSLTTYYFDNISDDPDHSPQGTIPFVTADTNKTSFTVPGVYDVMIDITDDDGGTAQDSLPMLMTDSRECTDARAIWGHEYGQGGNQTIDDGRLQGYLDIIRFASAYFDDGNLADLAAAKAVFSVNGINEDQMLKERALAAWLNFASGGVLWDQEIKHLDGPFHEVIGEIDAVLLDPDATKKEIIDAQQDAIRINTNSPSNASCNDAGTP